MFKTKKGKRLKSKFAWNKKQVWVRHDDHYHVDFEVTRALKAAPKKDGKAGKDAKAKKK